jgi:phospholipase/lecithinase/hemolysin
MATPKQKLEAKFESKEKLVSQLLPYLEAAAGESKEAHQARLLRISNTKLLRLATRVEKLKAAGGKNVLAQKLTELQVGPKASEKEKTDRTRKNQSLTLGQLLDQHKYAARRA